MSLPWIHVASSNIPEEKKQNFYIIDHNDDLIDTDAGWNQFAYENMGESVSRDQILDQPLWKFISGETTRHIYKNLLDHVRSGVTIRFNFRCDSPDMKRYFKMVISPLPDGHVKFETFVAKPSEPRDPYYETPPQTPPIITCSWCKKITSGDDVWHEIQDAVKMLRIFETDPPLSHGICIACYDTIFTGLSKK